MKYILFVFGTYDKNEFVLEKVGDILSRISSSKVNFRLGPTGGIFCFNSLMNSDQIDENLYNYLSLFSAMYFITPFTDQVVFGIQDQDVCDQLMGYEEEHDNLSEEKNLEQTLNLGDVEYRAMTEEQVRDFMKRISDIEEVLERLTPPTLDQILDKINEVGLQNLTEIEKTLLDEYAKG